MLYLNGARVNTGNFPNKESYVAIDKLKIPLCTRETPQPDCTIDMVFECNDDLINLMLLKRHIDDLCIPTNLTVRSLPYARMDRQNKNYVFSLKYICGFINQLNFKSVLVCEPHSDVAPALLDRCLVYNWIERKLPGVVDMLHLKPTDWLFFPDTGAQKRYGDLAAGKFNVAVGNKKRDFQTGRITSYDIVRDKIAWADDSIKCLIVDDLCSKGGTFELASESIKHTMGIRKIYLMVAHCEQTIFDGGLLKTRSLIKKIFTSDSMVREPHKKIIIIP